MTAADFTEAELAAAQADVAYLDAEFPEQATTHTGPHPAGNGTTQHKGARADCLVCAEEDIPASTPRRRRPAPPRIAPEGGAGECSRCHKPLKWPSDDGLGPVCRRIAAAERAVGGDQQ